MLRVPSVRVRGLIFGTVVAVAQLLTLLITHLVACGFYGLANEVAEGEDKLNWLSVYTEGNPFVDEHWTQTSVSHRYLQALYWAFITVTTVGYGDIL